MVCGQVMVNGLHCDRDCVAGDTMCKLHRTVANRREQQRRADIVWTDVLDVLWAHDLVTEFDQVQAVLDGAYDNGWIERPMYDELSNRLRRHWVLYRRQRAVPPGAKATTKLQRIALDKQNVHTKEVAQQMNDGTKYLLRIPVPDYQDTLAEMTVKWTNKKPAQLTRVMADVKKWYKKKTVVNADDYLYERMLDGLWVRVKDDPELLQRLWEELSESVDKCCQGHLSRLTNVLVGFTDEVKAEIPVGELLQHKMSAIAAKDASVESKVEEARGVLEELKVPMAERSAWIEAF